MTLIENQELHINLCIDKPDWCRWWSL